tara:strand:- start:196 stop:351 length:156 start_codon:yes stop_codon:yes gene_type:complete
MKLNRKILKSLIAEEMKRLSYAAKDQGFTYGIEHLPDYHEPEKADDIIGHT